jgi:hypothetical protein
MAGQLKHCLMSAMATLSINKYRERECFTMRTDRLARSQANQIWRSLLVLISMLGLTSCGGQLGAGNNPNFSYATVSTNKPANSPCLGKGGGIAKEMLNAKSFEIVVAGGAGAISDTDWAALKPSFPWTKNSTRHLLFSDSCFFRSPGAPIDCSTENCFTTKQVYDHSWLLLTTVANTTCMPDSSGCPGQDVKPGFISVNTIDKCQVLIFSGPLIYELSDPAGNRYVMHATATGTPDLTGPQLPAGWKLEQKTISEPLVLNPHGGAGHCYYNIIRDNLVQSYHQYVYAGQRWP